ERRSVTGDEARRVIVLDMNTARLRTRLPAFLIYPSCNRCISMSGLDLSSDLRWISVSTTTGAERVRRLEAAGIASEHAHWNLGVAALYEHALARHEGLLAAEGPLVCRTGSHT